MLPVAGRLNSMDYGPHRIRPMLNAAHILLQNPRTDVRGESILICFQSWRAFRDPYSYAHGNGRLWRQCAWLSSAWRPHMMTRATSWPVTTATDESLHAGHALTRQILFGANTVTNYAATYSNHPDPWKREFNNYGETMKRGINLPNNCFEQRLSYMEQDYKCLSIFHVSFHLHIIFKCIYLCIIYTSFCIHFICMYIISFLNV